MNILITGGGGFLGQHLIQRLKKLNAKITNLDLMPVKGVENIRADITDYEQTKDAFKEQDIVVHAAGIVSFLKKDKDQLNRVNIEGTRTAVRAAKENKVKRFIHISSVAALGYKDDKNQLVDEQSKFDWSIAQKNSKHYMLSKKKADEIVENANINAVIIYPGLMYGPGDEKHTKKLIEAAKNKKIMANAPGGTNIVDVRDVADGIACIIEQDIKKGRYILSGENLTFTEINKIIAEELGIKPPRITLPTWSKTALCKIGELIESINKNAELAADLLHSSFLYRYFTNAKAKKELGWKPKYNFRQTIKDSIKWMENGAKK